MRTPLFSLRLHQLLTGLVLFSLILSAWPASALAATPTPTPPPPTPAAPVLVADGLKADLDPAIDVNAHDPSAPLTVVFSQPMDPDSARLALVTFPYADGQFTWSENNTRLTFQPAAPLEQDTNYMVFLDGGLTSLSGERFSTQQQWALHTTRGPRVSTLTPSTPNLGHRRPRIQVRFDRAMQRTDLKDLVSVQPPVELEITWASEHQLIIQPKLLTPSEHYQFTIDGQVQDEHGIPMGEPYAWDYWLPPAQPTQEPENGQVSDYFALRFPYAIDIKASGEAANLFTIQPPVEGKWTWVGQTIARFTPGKDSLAPGTQYTVSVSGPLIDTNGEPYPQVSDFHFSPKVPIEKIPGEDGEDWRTCWSVELAFEVPMNHASVEAAFSVTPTLTGTMEWDRNTFIFDPQVETAAEHHFTLATTAQNAQGQPVLVEPLQWTLECYPERDNDYDDYDQAAYFGGYWGTDLQVVDSAGRRALQYAYRGNGDEVTFQLYRLTPEEFVQRYISDDWFRDMPERAAYAWGVWAEPTDASAHEVILPEKAQPGLYILQLKVGEERDQLLVALTHNTLVLKVGTNQVTAWAAPFSGIRLSRKTIRFYDADGTLVGEGRTDSEGLYRLPFVEGHKPVLALLEDEGGDITVSGTDGRWNVDRYWSYRCRWCGFRTDDPITHLRAFIYTERPIYRPGQMVNYKAILRQEDDVRYALLPASTPVTVTLNNPRGSQVEQQVVALNEFGSLNGTFTLSPETMLGDYTIQVKLEGEMHSQTFTVQDYHKPEYRLTLQSDQPRYIVGETVTVTMEARYFYDQPVTQGWLGISLYGARPDWMYGWRGEAGENNMQYEWDGRVVARKSATVDASGHYTYTFRAPGRYSDDYYYDYDDVWGNRHDSLEKYVYMLEARLHDASLQDVHGRQVIEVYSASERIGIEAKQYWVNRGERVQFDVFAQTLEGEPVAEHPLQVSLATECWYGSSKVITSTQITTSVDGWASGAIRLDQTGFFCLIVTGKDPLGNNMTHKDWVYVPKKRISQTEAGDGAEEEREGYVKITAEKTSYQPYETARFFIESNFSGPALITFERGRVNHTMRVVLEPPLTTVEAQMLEVFGPNVFITVSAWEPLNTNLATLLANQAESPYYFVTVGDRRLHTATTEIDVEVTQKALNVAVESDQAVYAAGDTAEIQIRVTDFQGQPAKAEVSLALVDEAIFSLRSDPSGPMIKAFYGRRKHEVDTYNSLGTFRYLFHPEFGGGGGGDEGPMLETRSNFQDTALWLPTLYTDDTGVVTATVTLPDNLTGWRVFARAHTKSTRVGEGTLQIAVQRPITLRPSLPGMLTVSDALTLTTQVHNYSAQIEPISVTLSATLLSTPLTLTHVITLEAGALGEVQWPVTATVPGEARVLIRAVARDNSAELPLNDTIELPVTVQPLAIPFAFSQSGQFTQAYTTTLVLPLGLTPTGEVQLQLGRSMSSELLQGMEFLTGYPYGCVEQTMSKALPNAVIGRALEKLNITNPELQASLPAMLRSGVEKLYGMQHLDGGWGWWYDDASDDYQTAWVVFGLANTSEAGFEVDPVVIENGAQYLTANLGSMDKRTRAFALYSLVYAGYGDLQASQQLAQEAHELDSFSQAALALALHKLGDTAGAEALLERLAALRREKKDGTYWPVDKADGEYHRKSMASTTRTTALALEAYLQIAPQDPSIPEIVRYLRSRRGLTGWGTTNETAFTLLALSDYLLSTQPATSEAQTVHVWLNGVEVQGGQMAPGDQNLKLDLPLAALKPGPNLISIRSESSRLLYYSLLSRLEVAQPQLEPQGVPGVTVKRTYTNPSGVLISSAWSGTLVRVKLEVTLQDPAYYLMLTDFLPAGLEAINENLNTSSFTVIKDPDDEDEWQEVFRWQELGYNYKEIRDNRVIFFISALKKGTHTFTYLARATRTGRFIALPAQIEAMYDPTLWARSGSRLFGVQTFVPNMPATAEGPQAIVPGKKENEP